MNRCDDRPRTSGNDEQGATPGDRCDSNETKHWSHGASSKETPSLIRSEQWLNLSFLTRANSQSLSTQTTTYSLDQDCTWRRSALLNVAQLLSLLTTKHLNQLCNTMSNACADRRTPSGMCQERLKNEFGW